MTATPIPGVALALAAMALAGCTGSFDVDQTEPFRVQLEGAPETVTVRDTDTEAKRVVVETCGDDVEVDSCDVEEVEVQFEVKQVSSGPCKILVTIQDESGRTITSRVIDVSMGSGDDDDSDDGMTGNGTTNGTASGNTTATGGVSATSGQTVIQNILVDVRGAKNIVVVTQAQQGTADINIQAVKASGNANVNADQDSTGTATTSATMTTTTSTNTTTGP